MLAVDRGGYNVISNRMDNALQLCDPAEYRNNLKYATSSSPVNRHASHAPEILDHIFVYSREGHYNVLEHQTKVAT